MSKKNNPREKTQSRQKKLAVAMALINSINNTTPLVLSFVPAIDDLPSVPLSEQLSRELSTNFNRGGQVLDRFFFTNAYASTISTNENWTAGTSSNDIIISGGTQNVFDDGITNDTVINSSGTQNVFDGGITNDTHISSGGTQNVSNGGATTGTVISSGGTQNVSTGGIATGTVINGGTSDSSYRGTQNVSTGGIANNTTVNSGGMQSVLSGGATTATVISGGTQAVTSGGATTGTIITGGVQQISGGTATNTTVNAGEQGVWDKGTAIDTLINGGVQNVSATTVTNTVIDGGLQSLDGANSIAINTTIHNGRQEVKAKASATNTTISGGTQIVLSNGTATDTTISGGTQTVSANGSATNTTIFNGGVQDVYGSATNTTISGGTQTVSANGNANNTTVFNGGVQDVYGSASDTTVSGGALYFHTNASLTGTTTLDGGFIQLMEMGSYSIDRLTVANSGNINLTGNSAADLLAGNARDKAVGRNLTIAYLTGDADFIINTDIANDSADFIKIGSGSGSHQLQVAYDPLYETRQNIKGKADFAEATASTTFTAVPTDYGAYRYTPILTSDASNIWSVIGFSELVDSSEMVYTAADAAAGSLKLWQRENNNLSRRLGDLRNADGKTGDWARIYKGEQTSNDPNGRSVSQRYTAIQAGHDTRVSWGDGAWRAGYTVGYLTADTSYNRGGSDYSSLTLGAYATWLGGKGHYLDVVLKGAHMSDKYDCRLLNPAETKVDARYRTWGTALSAEYGRRKNFASGWYIEPQTEISLAHVAGANYTTSDDTNIRHEGATSVVGRLGFSVGRNLRGTNFYAMVSWAREFNAKTSVCAASGGLSPVTLEKNLKENWLETAIGIAGPLGGNRSGYLEISSINGGKTKTPWQINAGVRWSF